MTETTVKATRYAVTCLTGESIDSDVFTINVEYRGHDRWAVMLRSTWCLSVNGQWEYEPTPSNREDDWLDGHRFDLDTALRLAKEHAPGIVVNGYTVAEAQAMQDSEVSHG